MMCGIGIDAVATARFERWCHFPIKTLLKVYTTQELAYCFANKLKTAERLAVRFAAKEAFYKAASGYFFEKPFFAIVHHVAVSHDRHSKPYLAIAWQNLLDEPLIYSLEQIKVHLSLTHTHDVAIAYVIIEQIKKSA